VCSPDNFPEGLAYAWNGLFAPRKVIDNFICEFSCLHTRDLVKYIEPVH